MSPTVKTVYLLRRQSCARFGLNFSIFLHCHVKIPDEKILDMFIKRIFAGCCHSIRSTCFWKSSGVNTQQSFALHKPNLLFSDPNLTTCTNISDIPCKSLIPGNRLHARIWRGVGGGGLEFAKLNITDITGNEKKKVIFNICALPQLYVKVGPPPPWKNFWTKCVWK